MIIKNDHYKCFYYLYLFHVTFHMTIFMLYLYYPCTMLRKHKVRKGMKHKTFERMVDTFFRDVSYLVPRNINVEMRERDGFRTFPNGVTSYILSEKTIDGGWYISIARHLRVFLCTTTLLRNNTKKLYATAFSLLFTVHASLRLPLKKTLVGQYQMDINELVHFIKKISRTCPMRGKGVDVVKLHLPYHWAHTRMQLGCAAAEKSLERKLGEAQKKYFPLTNGKDGAQVCIGPYMGH